MSTQPIVFIIDDEETVREALSSLFRSVGLQTKTFGSAKEFLQFKLPDAPACLVLDVRLPGMSGLDFQVELANIDIRVPIVFISGHADVPMSVKAMKRGAIEFLTKPIRDQDLLDAVRLAIERDHVERQRTQLNADLRTRFDSLTSREKEVFALVSTGLMNKQIAGEMDIREVTVKVHRGNVMRKMGARSLAALVRMADAVKPTEH
ncbi:MAG: response regulator transcription factor [Alphaproteobacteria bacterium]|nr:MAG: response regulator transcription factor [Alphaproteobacteria bacterium]